MTGPHLVLIGMMGAGKSTVGREAAARLNLPFVDIDEEIERREGRSVAAIFADDGEGAFRAVESVVLDGALQIDEPTVIAAGGGAILDPINRERTRSRGTVVWLRAEPHELQRRLGEGSGRPLLDGADSVEEKVVEMVRTREPIYRDAAQVVVDVDGRTIEQVTDDVVAALGPVSR